MQANFFRNIGYLLHKLDDNDMKVISSKIKDIEKNFNAADKMNYQLIGQIENEFSIYNEDTKKEAETFLKKAVSEYDKNFSYLRDKARVLSREYSLDLNNLWVNFQKKHEFNPCHNHDGVYSFVIWYKIPYSIEDEMKNSPGKNANSNLAGHFEFSFTNSLGNIWQESLPVDKSWEGTLCLFPSEMIHTVYPFYSSDDYRITVSGNIGLI